ncbi:kinase-like domain-containing protein [Lanmaoa asiatica]|nr:kinase-like domain-containing protein [Lanmaoa asiatica]
MVDIPEVEPYIPQFFWRFWLSDADPRKHTLDDHRVHIYDVFNNILSETRRIPEQTRTVFHDFITDALDEGCHAALHTAEQAFTRLENDVERILAELVLRIRAHVHADLDTDPDAERCAVTRRFEVPMSKRDREALLRYFVFLRYRNSEAYKETVGRLTRRVVVGEAIVQARHAWHRVRRRAVLGNFHAFLHRDGRATQTRRRFQGFDCWRFLEAEMCFGVASEEQQFVLPDTCFASLDEDFGGDPTSTHFLFPVMPTLALYVLGVQDQDRDDDVEPPVKNPRIDSTSRAGHDGAVWVDVGIESRSDVHLRNASLLQRNPAHLYFSSLTSLVQALANYDECRWIPEHCRLLEAETTRATQGDAGKGHQDIARQGERAVGRSDGRGAQGGTRSGLSWWFLGRVEGNLDECGGAIQSGTVALKFLRQYQSVADNVREKLLKRLKSEVAAWHRLQHANICPLYGVIQSVHSIAMVSPWCNNGTIMQYIQREDVHADRLTLLGQIASGVSYLHNMKPVVVHGDLKGTNILISDDGDALISDFGLSTVIEEFSLTDAGLRAAQLGTSLLAGSTRWMAPELILSLVEDDGVPCPTRESDVFSFACVCLEVATNDLPYPNRRNDRAVTIDILRGVRPCRGAPPVPEMRFTALQEEAFWGVLDQCWNAIPPLRPTMTDVGKMLGGDEVLRWW